MTSLHGAIETWAQRGDDSAMQSNFRCLGRGYRERKGWRETGLACPPVAGLTATTRRSGPLAPRRIRPRLPQRAGPTGWDAPGTGGPAASVRRQPPPFLYPLTPLLRRPLHHHNSNSSPRCANVLLAPSSAIFESTISSRLPGMVSKIIFRISGAVTKSSRSVSNVQIPLIPPSRPASPSKSSE